MLGASLSPEESLAHWIAAIRELFEEAGVLLSYDRDGNFLDPGTSMGRVKFSRYRTQLQERNLPICHVAREEKIFFALDQLHYYAHWITPEARPERFDTRFFLSRHPLGQEASYDRRETTEGTWLTPQKALEGNMEGSLVLSPPTLKTLEDLSRFKDMDEVFQSLKGNRIQPILPVLTKVMDDPVIIFPWDPEYEVFEKGGIPFPADHGRPSRSGDNTSRVIFKEGRWLPYCR
jgi:8-oxo-dGTP pyrophosphatase MutT (NUDIX family)